MRPIDAAYLYELGAAVRPMKSLSQSEIEYLQAYWPLITARDTIVQLFANSIFAGSLRPAARSAANNVLIQINELIKRIEDGDIAGKLEPVDTIGLSSAMLEFEPILTAELSGLSIFYVSSKGGFNNEHLVDGGHALFPEDLSAKVPEAIADVNSGARCLAFEMWTAAAFHMHRANEAVLRAYFDHVAGLPHRPKTRTMGTMLARMENLGVGDANILSALKSIVNFHRNPIIHPGDLIETAEEALSLYAALRAAMGYMLDKLSVQPPPPVITQVHP